MSSKRCSGNVRVLSKIGYRLGKTIGNGTYSKVRVSENSKGEKFACKVIKKKATDKDFLEKFVPREIEIITSVKHPNIIRVYKILESNDAIYMFMDYCKNGDLLEYIKASGCFPENQAKTYFKQIVEAVGYLHRHNIAHRDLKCENVFLTCTNQIKLGDFGFARLMEKITDLSDTFCGSAAYAAPEILKGISYNPKMYDMWALGCILYIMVTGSMPFDDSNLRIMIRKQLNKSLKGFTLFCPEHSGSLKKLIYDLLEPDLDRRINIEEVKRHEWFREDYVAKVKKFLSISDSNLI